MVGPEPLAIAFRSHNTKMRNVVRYGNPNLRLAKRSDLPPRASEDAPSLGKPSRTLEAHSNRSRVARLLDPPATARTSAECEIELHWRCGRSSPQTHEYARDPADRKSVVSGKSVSVRVEFGGRRIIQKKKKHKNTR